MILVIDNYDSFTYNLVHLVARIDPDIEVVRNDQTTIGAIRKMDPTRILISPGPGRPSDAGITPDVIRQLGSHIPILGVCLGHQALGEVFGGTVTYAPSVMHGKTSRIEHDERTIFRGIPQNFEATRYHSLVVDRASLPTCFEITAWTSDHVIMGLRHRSLPLEGVQFHPESVLTQHGDLLIRNWLTAAVAMKSAQTESASS